ELWFLAQLFVSPAQQGSGIGNELIRRAWEPAKAKGATNQALITFTFNAVSQGLYLRHGMFPRFPIYFFAGASERVKRVLNGPHFRCVALEETSAHLNLLAGIDAQSLGVSRAKHHRYLINDTATKGVLLYENDSCVGYAYIAEGHIGPMAVTQGDKMSMAFKTALALATHGEGRQ